ncbi:BTAD domain-containing putative transcriptional regulator [Nocardia sp. NPDC005978]|uniref:ATP-binding protein n=1 Tax=Nocardia sp. NPDC005978 TaxID=3156725 RepID=UPI0033B049B4
MTIELFVQSADDAEPEAAADELRLQVLGPLRVWQGEIELHAGPRQQAYLLGLLLARHGRPTGADELIDLIWGEDAPASALNVLHKYIGAIRRILQPDLPARESGAFLLKRASGYVCTIGPDILDLARFREFTARARSDLAAGDTAAAFDRFLDAVALWSGPAGDGWTHNPDAAPIFAALNDEFLQTCVEVARLADSLGESTRALPALRRAAAMAALHEPVQAALVTLLGRAGRQAEALEVFDAVRRRLDEELGIDPGTILRAARQGVLTQLTAWSDAPRTSPVILSPTATLGMLSAADESLRTPVARPGIVGRSEELAALDRALEPALLGGRAIVVLEGEPGVGKSRLMESLAHDAESRGALVVWGHCLDGDGAPTMWPWVEVATGLLDALPAGRSEHWLSRDLGHFVGAHRDEMPANLDGNARFRLLEQMVDVITESAAARPVALIFDDLQWAEPSSLQLLDAVVKRLPPAVAVIAAMRDRGTAPSLELTRTLATMSRTSGHRRIFVGPLAPAEVGELVRSETGIIPPAEVIEMIYRRTTGNPFFVRELARLLGPQGVSATEAVALSGVPLTVRDVVRDRLAAMGGDTIALLEVAALIGRSVELLLLARAASLDVGTCLERLEPVRDLGLIGPVADDPFSYRYTHDLVRQAVSEGVSPVRRSAIHGHIADAIETGALSDESAPERLAHHLWSAGPITDPGRTVSALIGAGSRATAKTSLQAAERHLGSAVELARKASLLELELAALSQLIAVVGMRSMYGIASVSLLERAEQVARRLGDERVATGFLFSRWTAHGQGLQLEQSTVLADQLDRLASTSADPVVRMYGTTAVGIHRWCIGEVGESFRRLDAISPALVPQLDPLENDPVRDGVQLMAAGMFAEITGYHGDLARADDLFATLGMAAGRDPYAVTVATSFEARTAAVAGDALGALRAADRGIAVDPEFSFVSLGTYLRLARLWGQALTGLAPADAAGAADELIRGNLSSPARTCVSTWLALLAEMYLAAGSSAAAAAALDRADDALIRYGQRSAEPLVILVRAELARAEGDDHAAVRAAERARALARQREAHLFAERAERFLIELRG